MKCTFRAYNPNLLMEAKPGQLFNPLGPVLVECVCTLLSHVFDGRFVSDQRPKDRLNPEASVPVVVIACRVAPGEPEYYPPGFQTALAGASPVAFLDQVEALALRAHAPVCCDNTRPELASRL